MFAGRDEAERGLGAPQRQLAPVGEGLQLRSVAPLIPKTLHIHTQRVLHTQEINRINTHTHAHTQTHTHTQLTLLQTLETIRADRKSVV